MGRRGVGRRSPYVKLGTKPRGRHPRKSAASWIAQLPFEGGSWSGSELEKARNGSGKLGIGGAIYVGIDLHVP